MENFEIIRKAHAIDHDLRVLGGSLLDESLRERVLAVQSSWRDLAYAISASACGMNPVATLDPPKKRGRRKRTEERVGPAGLDSPEGPETSGEAHLTHHSSQT
jgi:hypothetical protein